MEQQRKQLKKEIQQVNLLLFTEHKKQKNAVEDLKDIKQKINVRLKLIRTINLEAIILSKGIKENQKNIDKLTKELAVIKEVYAAIIFKSYKSKSKQSRIMFLFSSQNFYQAYKRLEYMKQYTSYRKKQGEDIVIQTTVIQKLNDSLSKQKKTKDRLIESEKEEKEEIEADKKKQEQLISTIKSKESRYKRDLQRKIVQDRKVVAKIDKIIRSEIVKANKNVKNKPKISRKNEFYLSPKARVLAAKFEANKGKLPWPVKEGLVTRKFGRQPHPSFPGITINGTGLHIVTKKGNNATAIFNGKVLNILVTAEGRKNVLIRHGNYISSYNNLSKLYVKKGGNVVTGQKIGQIFTDKVSGKTKLIFVLFKNTTRLNPASWILKR
ncbi:MAG: murein hydrolase activator EnvC family protein [Polaribacter sp.]